MTKKSLGKGLGALIRTKYDPKTGERLQPNDNAGVTKVDMKRFEFYRKALSQAWSDGEISEDENTMLATMREYLNVSDREHDEIEKEVRTELGHEIHDKAVERKEEAKKLAEEHGLEGPVKVKEKDLDLPPPPEDEFEEEVDEEEIEEVELVEVTADDDEPPEEKPDTPEDIPEDDIDLDAGFEDEDTSEEEPEAEDDEDSPTVLKADSGIEWEDDDDEPSEEEKEEEKGEQKDDEEPASPPPPPPIDEKSDDEKEEEEAPKKKKKKVDIEWE